MESSHIGTDCHSEQVKCSPPIYHHLNLNKLELTTPDYSTVIYRTYLFYLEEKLGEEKARSLISQIGGDFWWDYLKKESNWVSQKFADIFYELLDSSPEIPEDHAYEAACYTFDRRVSGIFALMALKLSGPSLIYKNIIRISKTWNRVDSLSITSQSKNCINIKFISKRKTPHLPHIARGWQAAFEHVPPLFGLPKAFVILKMEDDYRTACFEIRWVSFKRFRLLNRLLLGIGLGSEKLDKLAKEEEWAFEGLINFLESSTQKEDHLHNTIKKLNSSHLNDDVTQVVKQVSHDIRSPLAALNMMIKYNLKSMPEDIRLVVRTQIDRIYEVANNLLRLNKPAGINANTSASSDEDAPQKMGMAFIINALEEIIVEKRLNFISYPHLAIESEFASKQLYGVFVKINIPFLKRIISNLINNSAEALPDFSGKIIVQIHPQNQSKGNIQIVISDNGKGIPPQILPRLGQQGVSFGKEKNSDAGSGLGLFHARTTVEKWGGQFFIESRMGEGTKIIINLPHEIIGTPTSVGGRERSTNSIN